jgi:hypothetical protein
MPADDIPFANLEQNIRTKAPHIFQLLIQKHASPLEVQWKHQRNNSHADAPSRIQGLVGLSRSPGWPGEFLGLGSPALCAAGGGFYESGEPLSSDCARRPHGHSGAKVESCHNGAFPRDRSVAG